VFVDDPVTLGEVAQQVGCAGEVVRDATPITIELLLLQTVRIARRLELRQQLLSRFVELLDVGLEIPDAARVVRGAPSDEEPDGRADRAGCRPVLPVCQLRRSI